MVVECRSSFKDSNTFQDAVYSTESLNDNEVIIT